MRLAAITIVLGLGGCNQILGIGPIAGGSGATDDAGGDADIGRDGIGAIDARGDAPLPGCASTYPNRFGTHRYQVGSTNMTFVTADATCQVDGGHLVKIEDDAENTAVKTITASLGNPWIGLSDVATEGTFVWMDGTALGPYTSWESGEPTNSSNEDCVQMSSSNGGWNDTNCGQQHPFVCECDASAP